MEERKHPGERCVRQQQPADMRRRRCPINPEPSLQSELLSYLGQLGSNDQARVVDFARSLAKTPNGKQVGAQQVGAPGKNLLPFVGMIPHEELMEMKRAI